MGVRSGGCSGMSYVMDFMQSDEVDTCIQLRTLSVYHAAAHNCMGNHCQALMLLTMSADLSCLYSATDL